jgi:hypothetical protein
MDEPNDHAIALSMAQAVEADAELIATLVREEEQARRDYEFARRLGENPDAIPESGDGADDGGLDDETYRTLQAFNVAVQPGESTAVETELSHEKTHDAPSAAGGNETGVASATGDDSQSDADNQSNYAASQDDGSQKDEDEIQAEEIQPEEPQGEPDADKQTGTPRVASSAPSELHVETEECLYCSEELPKDEIFEAPCAHGMCQPCLIKCIQTSIKDESLFPPKCCGKAIPIDTANLLIPEDLFTEYEDKREEHATAAKRHALLSYPCDSLKLELPAALAARRRRVSIVRARHIRVFVSMTLSHKELFVWPRNMYGDVANNARTWLS